MLNIVTSSQNRQQTVYNFQRSSESDFRVGVNWERSPGVRQGGYGVSFKEDHLEVRGGNADWDIFVAPKGNEQSVMVMAPRTGVRSPGAVPPLSRVDFPEVIRPEDHRKMALQVASALIGIPFLENMLSLPVPA